MNPTTKRLTAASERPGPGSDFYRATLDALRSYEAASERRPDYPPDDVSAAHYLAEAQVYATLALVAR